MSTAVRVGDVFTYVFDLGDGWTHRCEVIGRADPEETLGIVPDRPLPSWGWGTIPDQYGRRWEDDDGESDPPARADVDLFRVPEPDVPGPLDVRALRRAAASGSVAEVLEALTAVDLTPALQHAGSALLSVWRSTTPRRREPLVAMMVGIANRLSDRGWEGDDILLEDLLREVRGEDPAGVLLPVRLDELETGGGPDGREGCYLNTRTGEVVPAAILDAGLDDDDLPDVEDPAWRFVDARGTSWSDLGDFTRSVRDETARARLADAIEGRGAFSRFRRVVDDLGLVDPWLVYRDDRQLGRARVALAAEGIRTTA